MVINGAQECRVINGIGYGVAQVTCCRGWYVIRRLPGRNSAIMTIRTRPGRWRVGKVNICGTQECREIYGVAGSVTGNTIR